MIPSAFDEETCVLEAPPCMTSEECNPLSVWRGFLSDGRPAVISCWKPTKDELAEIAKTGRVWLLVWGQTMPPAAVEGFSPFSKPAEVPDGH